METKRIEYIDFIKGFCIFLVVWAHCIQNMGTKDGDFFNDPVHIFIVSFHMPIFMILSGFFLSKIKGKNFRELVTSRARQLLLPCFVWALVGLIISYHELFYNLSFGALIKQLLYNTFTQFWFLRSVFLCFIGAVIALRIFKKDYVACLVSVFIVLLLPDDLRLALDKFMYPFFWAGYFLHKHIEFLTLHRKKVMSFSFVLFMLMLFFWKKDYYIYVTGMSFYELQGTHIHFFDFWPRFNIVFFRYAIGLLGSIFFFFLLQAIYRPTRFAWIEATGTRTLGIYIIHLYLMRYLISHYILNQWGIIYEFIITPITAIILIILCTIIIKLLQKNRYTDTFFLGTKFKMK